MDKILRLSAATGVAVMVVVVTIQVILRYIFHSALDWAEEAARFLLVWISFIGIVLGLRENKHIGIDAFVYWLPKKLRLLVDVVALTMSAIFWVILVVGGMQLSQSASDQLSPALQIKMSLVYLIVPLSGVLLLLISMQDLRKVVSRLVNRRTEQC